MTKHEIIREIAIGMVVLPLWVAVIIATIYLVSVIFGIAG